MFRRKPCQGCEAHVAEIDFLRTALKDALDRFHSRDFGAYVSAEAFADAPPPKPVKYIRDPISNMVESVEPDTASAYDEELL